MDFNQIPSQLRTPLAYVEFDSSRALTGLAIPGRKVLLIGMQLAGNQGVANALNLVAGKDDAARLYGISSQLYAMFVALKAVNPYAETWAIGVTENAAGVAATGNFSITGPATAAGTLTVYIGGKQIAVAVANGDIATVIATNLIAAINADATLPVSALVDAVHAYQVNVTARSKGVHGNDIDLRTNYQTGDQTPAGLAVAVTPMAAGTLAPALATAIGNMGDSKWNTVISGFSDDTSLDSLEAEMDTRWGPMSMKAGRIYAAFRGTLSATNTYGAARNSKHSSVMGIGLSPTLPWVFAAVDGIVCEGSLSIDAARPVQTLALPGCLPPKQEDAFTLAERNTLLYDGISTYTTDVGACFIERQITTYQTSASGADDPSYLDVETLETLDFFRVATVQRILLKFPRHKLANDGTRFNPGQAIVTPSIIKGELIALFTELEAEGLVEDAQQFATDLVVQRNAQDPNRLDVLASPNLVNQFRIFAEQVQFIVQ